MLERGADVNFVRDDDFTALFAASQFGRLEIVDVLVAAGAVVNWARKEDGCTALMMASQNGHHEIKGLIHRILGNTPYVSNVETNKAGKNASQYGG
jgi:ankyrin repeat protein